MSDLQPESLHPGVSTIGVRTAWLPIATVVLLTIFYFAWTTACSFNEPLRVPPREHRETDHYNMLSRGFLQGHLHLDGEVPKALLDAPNPYDPKSRGNVEVLHDASFYRGKYYIYFGPAPVVTLFLPFTVLTGRDLPVPFAVFIFAAGAFLAIGATLLTLQRRYFPAASAWTICAGLIAIGGGSMIVALLRRPHIWEVAEASGLFYFAVSVYCLVRAYASARATMWSSLGGLALGLAVASRPTYIVCSVVFVLPLLFRQRSSSSKSNYGWPSLFAAAAGCTLIVAGLLAYNFARFGNPLEFGQKYQLSSIIEGDARHFSLEYLAFNFHVYFLSTLRWTDAFPFHHGVAVPPLPPGHGGYEYSIGVLANLPFSWFSVVSLVAAACWIKRPDRRGLTLGVVIVATTFALQAGLLLCYFGSCIRYMAEFTPWIMATAAIGVLIAESALQRRWPRVGLRVAAMALALGSALAAGLAVVNLYLQQNAGLTPAAYRPVARVMNQPFMALRHLTNPQYRPIEIEITFPAAAAPRQEPLVTVRRAGQTTAMIFVDYLEGSKLRFGYRESAGDALAYSPVIAPQPGARHRLQVSLGTHYAGFDGYKFPLRLHVDGWRLWEGPVISSDAFPGTLEIGKDEKAAFSGTIHFHRLIRDRDFSEPTMGGARLRFTLQPEMAGRSFPLMTTGRTDAGDLLFMRVEKTGSLTFGYDHWADELRLSPEIAARFGDEYVVEFWPPATNHPKPDAAKDREVVVKLNGSVAWRRRAPFFPATPATVFVGLNPIGGSTCEATFPYSVLEQTQIAPPVEP